ncbi:hypothetical protein JTE90_023165 [Oedothorax gibbosus]|uniref:Uncharacterized protein n=1 Tax=Oedothorax gibbosus TaxID=931172 RepID=A0AAV6UPR9_9ARAC|nr:hypothetical protein JTE90_023165 [Oedothorax gibbosus]
MPDGFMVHHPLQTPPFCRKRFRYRNHKSAELSGKSSLQDVISRRHSQRERRDSKEGGTPGFGASLESQDCFKVQVSTTIYDAVRLFLSWNGSPIH